MNIFNTTRQITAIPIPYNGPHIICSTKFSMKLYAVTSFPFAIFKNIVNNTTPDPSLNNDSISSNVLICNDAPNSLNKYIYIFLIDIRTYF